MTLYHWTSPRWLTAILTVGQIRGTDNQLAGRRGHRRGPDVVWLTDRDTPERLESVLGVVEVRPDGSYHTLPPFLTPADYRKTRVRLDVEVTDAERAAGWWPRWARRHGIRESWYQDLAEVAASSGGHPHDWFVLEGPVGLDRVRGIYLDGHPVR